MLIGRGVGPYRNRLLAFFVLFLPATGSGEGAENRFAGAVDDREILVGEDAFCWQLLVRKQRLANLELIAQLDHDLNRGPFVLGARHFPFEKFNLFGKPIKTGGPLLGVFPKMVAGGDHMIGVTGEIHFFVNRI